MQLQDVDTQLYLLKLLLNGWFERSLHAFLTNVMSPGTQCAIVLPVLLIMQSIHGGYSLIYEFMYSICLMRSHEFLEYYLCRTEVIKTDHYTTTIGSICIPLSMAIHHRPTQSTYHMLWHLLECSIQSSRPPSSIVTTDKICTSGIVMNGMSSN